MTSATGDEWRRSAALRIDDVCVRFETLWQKGERPRLEDFLAEVPETERAELLHELLAVELQWRRKTGEALTVAEYRLRFEQFADKVDAAFDIAFRTVEETDNPKLAETRDHSGKVRVRCPDCHSTIDVFQDSLLDNITCSRCQAAFQLANAESTTPRKIAQFELIDQLGMGAFGVVWKAHDTQLDRCVAMKIPRRGQLDREETAKFLREARAVAQLQHPNIVAVHELGLDGDSVYIVSDFIEGGTLDELTDSNRMSHREAAELCVTIAEALQYAHLQGIVHRDLKPGNIMVDELGKPWIMDFGLAKREVGELTMTMEGQVMGTPAYMAPEQARGESHQADRRTDIYSLGVILYELLTGERPFRGDLRMLLKQVIEDEPLSPRRLDSHITSDLETICLKCLAKEPAARYASAQHFADDLKCYLQGEPISARAVSRAERVWRWCRRKPLVASLWAATVFGVLCGVFGSAYAYVQASYAYVQASLAASDRQLAASDRQRAELSFQMADDLYTEVTENALLEQPGMQELRGRLLEKARDYYQQFMELSSDAADMRQQLALAHFRVASATAEVDSYEESLVPLLVARDIQQQLVAESPSESERLLQLGDTLNELGNAYNHLQQLDEALDYYHDADAVRSRYVALVPNDLEAVRKLANSAMNIGQVLIEQGKLDQADAHIQRAQGLRKPLLAERADAYELKRDFGVGLYNLALLRQEQNRLDDYEQLLHGSMKVFEELTQGNSREIDDTYRLCVSYRLLADRMAATQKWNEAISLLELCRPLSERLVDENRDVNKYREQLAALYLSVRNWAAKLLELVNTQDMNHGLETARRARDLFHKLVNRPDGKSVERDDVGQYVAATWSLAQSLDDAKKKEQAAKTWGELERYLNDLPVRHPGLFTEEELSGLLQDVRPKLDRGGFQ